MIIWSNVPDELAVQYSTKLPYLSKLQSQPRVTLADWHWLPVLCRPREQWQPNTKSSRFSACSRYFYFTVWAPSSSDRTLPETREIWRWICRFLLLSLIELKYFLIDVEDEDEQRGQQSHGGLGLVQLDWVEWSLSQCLPHQVQDQGEVLQWALSQWTGTNLVVFQFPVMISKKVGFRHNIR